MSADRPKGGDEPLPAELRALLDEGRREALRPEAKAAIRARVPERVSPAPWKLAAGGGVILAVALGVAFWPRGGTPDRPAASGPAVEDAASVGGGRGPDGEVVPDGAGRAARGAEAAPDGPLPSNAGREPRRSADERARATGARGAAGTAAGDRERGGDGHATDGTLAGEPERAPEPRPDGTLARADRPRHAERRSARGLDRAGREPGGDGPAASTEGPAPAGADAPAGAAPEAAGPTSTLQEEVRLLRRAHAALEADRPHDALAALAEHAARFEDGVLRLEREAARHVARCERGASPATRARARAFADRHPSAPLAARIRRACAEPRDRVDENP